jgi:hypothetical protein
MERSKIPEQLILDRENQYRIATSRALLDSLSLIAQELTDNPPDFKPSSILQIIFSISELAHKAPTHIVESLQFTHEITRLVAPKYIYGNIIEEAGTSESRTIGTSLRIVDNDMNPTAHFIAAANIVSGDEQWLQIHHANDMQRLDRVGQEIVEYHKSRLLPLRNDGPHTLEWLKGIVRDADFYISQYDPSRK